MGVEHQALVGAGLLGLNRGQHAVQLGMGVQLGVLAHRQAAHLGDGGQPQASPRLARGHGMLRDDRHRGAGAAERGVLERPDLDAPGDHQPGVGVVHHAVGDPHLLQRRHDAGPVAADVEVDGARRLEQAVEVVVEEGPAPVVQAQPLPDAVAEQEAGIVDRDGRLRPGLQRAVDPDQDLRVAGVLLRGMGGAAGAGGRGVWHRDRAPSAGGRRGADPMIGREPGAPQGGSGRRPPRTVSPGGETAARRPALTSPACAWR